MKIIDSLIKIANDEEVPKKIRYADEIFTFNNKTYVSEDGEDLFSDMYNWLNDLNIKVEIIEEEKEIEKIEGSNLINTRDILELEMLINKRFADYDYKINELIDVINDMRDKENV